MPNSYNGWPAGTGWSVRGGQLQSLVVAGESFAPGVLKGDVHDVFEYLAQQLHVRVEPIVRADWHAQDDWGYNYRPNRNANNLSCHASATAIDYNATRHPNGKRGTFTAARVREIRKILAELDGVVRWGGDFTGTPDEMHFEIVKGRAEVARVAAKIRTGQIGKAAAVAAPSNGRPVLKLGSQGQDVKDLQARLNKLYPSYRTLTGGRLLVVDGDFGKATDTWVREFQKRSRITVDGIVGPDTYRRLGL